MISTRDGFSATITHWRLSAKTRIITSLCIYRPRWYPGRLYLSDTDGLLHQIGLLQVFAHLMGVLAT